MPGWDEASVDELLADPIVRDVMAADGVDPGELRALLYAVQRTIDCYAAKELCSTIPSADADRPTFPANRGVPDIRKSRVALADYSRPSTPPLGSTLAGEARCTARS
jgi:hypothetical protein